MRRSFGVPDERWLLPGPIFKLAKPFKATVAKVFRDTFAQFKNLFKKPPKPQIKPKQSKPSPATSCTTRNSFTGDTVVLMADGTSKSIKNVQLGDKVIATDPETGQQGARVVTALIRHGGDHDMVKITTGAGTVIHATDQHPFWDTIDQEWVNAEDLTTTDVLVTAGGTEVHVASVSTYVEDVVAYNLTIDDLHTYHVSDADILVHNCPSGNLSDPLPKSMPGAIAQAYDDVKYGRLSSHGVYSGREYSWWAGAREYRIPGRPDNERILMKILPNGEKVLGWTTTHYQKIQRFGAPHFPDSGWNRRRAV